MKTDNIENTLRIEEECVQLSAQVCHLQQQMDKAKADTKSRESKLLKEIEVLRSRETRVFQSLVPVDASIAEEKLVDPSFIPLPFSPLRTSSLTFFAGLGSSHSPPSLDIQRIQNALAMARENLAQEANALSQLRTEVEDLRRQMPDPSPP
ncbi:hypothetical protein EDC04DRAFT_2898026 [Pisolithus marmoratus]|nr:hypothetical protein EDC04DRAFT_2898026 [Pisolithus marmoratus]